MLRRQRLHPFTGSANFTNGGPRHSVNRGNASAEMRPANDASQLGDEMEEAVVLIEFAPHDGRLRASRSRLVDATIVASLR